LPFPFHDAVKLFSDAFRHFPERNFPMLNLIFTSLFCKISSPDGFSLLFFCKKFTRLCLSLPCASFSLEIIVKSSHGFAFPFLVRPSP
jgi:hypothetical protein